jgi:RHS repeat-associated protein
LKFLSFQFTGKERDAETGLDYFLARYYSGAQDRFLRPDEFKGGIVDPFTGTQIGQAGPLPYTNITNPQTLNKFRRDMFPSGTQFESDGK